MALARSLLLSSSLPRLSSVAVSSSLGQRRELSKKTEEIIETLEKYSAHNYSPLPVVLERFVFFFLFLFLFFFLFFVFVFCFLFCFF